MKFRLDFFCPFRPKAAGVEDLGSADFRVLGLCFLGANPVSTSTVDRGNAPLRAFFFLCFFVFFECDCDGEDGDVEGR